ncbi:enoyl-CoA hydratase-related protein [Nocardioides endophyticus]|uniref:Enoyl-CoA hydratase-related protein n=1 Tax=Nocardioides endophyticus TaxID=1353775 RepID=A0ABP8YG90_9ACTN
MTTAPEASEHIGYASAKGVATITLDRPGSGNAVTGPMTATLIGRVAEAAADDDVRVVIIRATGRHFCVGVDLAAHGHLSAPRREAIQGWPRERGGAYALAVLGLRKPVVSVVQGAAVGFGATLTLPTDIRIVGESARFAFPFVRRGITPEAVSTWLLPRVVGQGRASDWMLTGRMVGSAEAHAAGLASRVVPDDELDGVARSVAEDLAEQCAPAALAATRFMLWSMLGAADPWQAHRLESEFMSKLSGGADSAEGFASFLEKRSPQFGRVPDGFFTASHAWPAEPDDLDV